MTKRTDQPSPATGSRRLLDLVAGIEQGLRAFGRRNRSLRDFLAMAYTPATDPTKPDPLRLACSPVPGRSTRGPRTSSY